MWYGLRVQINIDLLQWILHDHKEPSRKDSIYDFFICQVYQRHVDIYDIGDFIVKVIGKCSCILPVLSRTTSVNVNTIIKPSVIHHISLYIIYIYIYKVHLFKSLLLCFSSSFVM